MCDIMAITKADGNNTTQASHAQAEYQNALHLFPERPDQWHPPVVTISALANQGIEELLDELEKFETWSKSRLWQSRREMQLIWQFEHEWIRQLKSHLHQSTIALELEKRILAHEISISEAVAQMIKTALSDR